MLDNIHRFGKEEANERKRHGDEIGTAIRKIQQEESRNSSKKQNPVDQA